MSTSLLDKENSSGIFHTHASGPRKFGDSLGGSGTNKVYSTPQQKLKADLNLGHQPKSIHKLKENANTEKRRALGDLLNTTKSSNRQSLVFNCATPKSNLGNSYGTPINKCMKKLTNDFERQSISSNKKSEREAEPENYPPVEKCFPQVDTFQDLFEDGKLSDLFLNKNVTYVPRLPSSSGRIGEEVEEFHDFDIYTDKSFDKEVKQMNKSIKNQQKQENTDCLEKYQEMPVLDLPPILEDFDLSLSESSFNFDC